MGFKSAMIAVNIGKVEIFFRNMEGVGMAVSRMVEVQTESIQTVGLYQRRFQETCRIVGSYGPQ